MVWCSTIHSTNWQSTSASCRVKLSNNDSVVSCLASLQVRYLGQGNSCGGFAGSVCVCRRRCPGSPPSSHSPKTCTWRKLGTLTWTLNEIVNDCFSFASLTPWPCWNPALAGRHLIGWSQEIKHHKYQKSWLLLFFFYIMLNISQL